MTLQCAGPLKFSEIQTEFGGTTPISLAEYYSGGSNGYVRPNLAGVPASGTNSVSNYYCKQKLTDLVIDNFYYITYTNDYVVAFYFSLLSNLVWRNYAAGFSSAWGFNGQDLNSYFSPGPFLTSEELSAYSSVSCSITSWNGPSWFVSNAMIEVQPTLANGWVGVIRSPSDESPGAHAFDTTIRLSLIA